jgi:hypothetical protein
MAMDTLPPHLRVCVGDVEATFKRALATDPPR